MGRIQRLFFSRSYIPVLIIGLLAVACNSSPSSVVFDQPQPIGAKDLSQFPDRICGSYRAEDSSSLLSIKEGLVIRRTDFDLKVSADSLDSCCVLVGDTLIDKSSGEKTGITVQRYADQSRVKAGAKDGRDSKIARSSKSGSDSKIGQGSRNGRDSIVLHLKWEDTLFRVSADHILRAHRHYYLLNERSDDSTWVVRSLDLHKNILTLNYIPDSVALHYLTEGGHDPGADSAGYDQLAKSARKDHSGDSANIRLQPIKKQFKKLVRQNGFAEGERFVRIADSSYSK